MDNEFEGKPFFENYLDVSVNTCPSLKKAASELLEIAAPVAPPKVEASQILTVKGTGDHSLFTPTTKQDWARWHAEQCQSRRPAWQQKIQKLEL